MPSRNLMELERMMHFNSNQVPAAKASNVAKACERPLPNSSAGKFSLLIDLGEVVVPQRYDHQRFIAEFLERNWDSDIINDLNEAFNDTNYAKTTVVLKPGQRFLVRAFGQTVSETSSRERLEFIAGQGGCLVGAQGIVLVHEQKRNQLLKGYWYMSFDKKDRLWRNEEGKYGLPSLIAYVDGGYGIDLGDFNEPFPPNTAVLCFTEIV